MSKKLSTPTMRTEQELQKATFGKIWQTFRKSAESHHKDLILESLANKEEVSLRLEITERIKKDLHSHLE